MCGTVRLVLLAAFAAVVNSFAASTTISNVAIRYDTDGNIVDCHSGNIVKMGESYFMYGEFYGNNHQSVVVTTDRPRLSVYTSKDLQAWTFGGLLHNNTNNTWAMSGLWPGAAHDMGTWWCPVGVYNHARNKMILWWTATPGTCCDANWGVAESDDGIHFTLITMNETGANYHKPSSSQYLPGDERTTAMLSSQAWARRRLLPGASKEAFGIAKAKDGNAVMIDDDGTGYIATTIINPDTNSSSGRSHVVAIELLSPDLRHAAGVQIGPTFPDEFVEGVMLFKRQGRYYVIYSSCCCACRAGAGVVVYSATNIAGPWHPQQRDVNCKPFPSLAAPLIQESAAGAALLLPPNGTFICAGMAAPSVDRRPTGRLIIPAQGFSVSALPGSHSYARPPLHQTNSSASGASGVSGVVGHPETTFMWLGQRWLSGPENPTNCSTLCTPPTGDCAQSPAYSNGNDFSYWVPLEFDAAGQVRQFEPFVKEWSLKLD
jgi:hypothetical protein